MRFASMTRANSSGVVCSKVAKSPTAARCTQVSSLPYSCTARSATAFTCSNSEVSAGTAVASPPSLRISSTREASPSSPRAETTTFAPRPANRRADSRPIPLEAPIRATTCSSTGFSRVIIAPCTFFDVLRIDRVELLGETIFEQPVAVFVDRVGPRLLQVGAAERAPGHDRRGPHPRLLGRLDVPHRVADDHGRTLCAAAGLLRILLVLDELGDQLVGALAYLLVDHRPRHRIPHLLQGAPRPRRAGS